MKTNSISDERDQKAESIHEAINIVLRDQGVNFNPRADDLGDEIDDFVELVLDFSEGKQDDDQFNHGIGLCNDEQMPDNICGQ
jgi:hypothetical protein